MCFVQNLLIILFVLSDEKSSITSTSKVLMSRVCFETELKQFKIFSSSFLEAIITLIKAALGLAKPSLNSLISSQPLIRLNSKSAYASNITNANM